MRPNPLSLLGSCTLALTLVLALALGGQASADGRGHRIVVTPTDQQGWSTADTRPGGTVTFVVDPTAPAGRGALELTTNATTTAKAQYLHAANVPLAGVTELSYYTKQNSAPFPGADPSYQVISELNGTTGFTTLVFEPYQNPLQGPVIPQAWQKWNVGAGLFWSTRTVVCANGTVVGTSGGPATYTLAQIRSLCPNAMVIGFGVNIGSNNPLYNVETDLFDFNGTVYDFEPDHDCGRDKPKHEDTKSTCGNNGDHENDSDNADD